VFFFFFFKKKQAALIANPQGKKVVFQ